MAIAVGTASLTIVLFNVKLPLINRTTVQLLRRQVRTRTRYCQREQLELQARSAGDRTHLKSLPSR